MKSAQQWAQEIVGSKRKPPDSLVAKIEHVQADAGRPTSNGPIGIVTGEGKVGVVVPVKETADLLNTDALNRALKMQLVFTAELDALRKLEMAVRSSFSGRPMPVEIVRALDAVAKARR